VDTRYLSAAIPFFSLTSSRSAKAATQLTTPNLGNNAGGHSVVESKK
jgi:hypothetical protein